MFRTGSNTNSYRVTRGGRLRRGRPYVVSRRRTGALRRTLSGDALGRRIGRHSRSFLQAQHFSRPQRSDDARNNPGRNPRDDGTLLNHNDPSQSSASSAYR
eukprot:7033418-Pyramimonas_sp.AAC.2